MTRFAEVVIDHLLEDRREFVDDMLLQVWRQSVPDRTGSGGHTTSHCSARVMNSRTASGVSLVRLLDRGGSRLVAWSGMRKVICSR